MAKSKNSTKVLNSMTGFGSSSFSAKDFSLDVEIKSVNGRFLDVNIKGPRLYFSIEQDIRKISDEKLSRGRVDILIRRRFFGRRRG